MSLFSSIYTKLDIQKPSTVGSQNVHDIVDSYDSHSETPSIASQAVTQETNNLIGALYSFAKGGPSKKKQPDARAVEQNRKEYRSTMNNILDKGGFWFLLNILFRLALSIRYPISCILCSLELSGFQI